MRFVGWLCLSGLMVVVAFNSCFESELVECGDGLYCPPSLTCDEAHGICVDPTQIDACQGRDGGVACTYLESTGACDEGVCLPVQCGNGILQPGELCDDGNTEAGDGCRGDCLATEYCGSGHLDPSLGEECDCGSWSTLSASCIYPNGSPEGLCSSECRFTRPGQWVAITAGSFDMGSPTDEDGRFGEFETQHPVTLTRDFEIQVTEVPQRDWERVMGYNPSQYPCGDECPVDTVAWFEAAAFANRLSWISGLRPCYRCTGEGREVTCAFDDSNASPYECQGYRLPTEAEWEYAARAGTTTATYNGDPDVDGELCLTCPVLEPIAWFCFNSGNTTHPVGGRDPNSWGLYDLIGNVWEWAHDGWMEDHPPDAVVDPWGPEEGGLRVIRGGCFANSNNYNRAAMRSALLPHAVEHSVGFRLARTLD